MSIIVNDPLIESPFKVFCTLAYTDISFIFISPFPYKFALRFILDLPALYTSQLAYWFFTHIDNMHFTLHLQYTSPFSLHPQHTSSLHFTHNTLYLYTSPATYSTSMYTHHLTNVFIPTPIKVGSTQLHSYYPYYYTSHMQMSTSVFKI